MYSLAMIMVEMLTHDMPFSDLMNYIDIADVLRGVAGVKNISSQLPQVRRQSMRSNDKCPLCCCHYPPYLYLRYVLVCY